MCSGDRNDNTEMLRMIVRIANMSIWSKWKLRSGRSRRTKTVPKYSSFSQISQCMCFKMASFSWKRSKSTVEYMYNKFCTFSLNTSLSLKISHNPERCFLAWQFSFALFKYIAARPALRSFSCRTWDDWDNRSHPAVSILSARSSQSSWSLVTFYWDDWGNWDDPAVSI